MGIPLVGWIKPWAESRRETWFGGFPLRNFGIVAQGKIYRSAFLSIDCALFMRSKIGLKTIIDLRGNIDPNTMAAREAVFLHNGFRFFNIPFDDKSLPRASDVARCYELMTDERNYPLDIHCAGGRHRTGGMVAFYRQRHDLWTPQASYDEAVDPYGFYTAWGHGDWKDFILHGKVAK